MSLVPDRLTSVRGWFRSLLRHPDAGIYLAVVAVVAVGLAILWGTPAGDALFDFLAERLQETGEV